MKRRDALRFMSAGSALALVAPGKLIACAPGDPRDPREPREPQQPETAGGTDKLARIGVQLYTLRTLMAKNVEDTLRQVAAIGFQEVEFAGYFNRNPTALRATLDSVGLTSPAAHIQLSDLEPQQWVRTLEAAKTIGHQYVLVAYFDQALRRTVDDWKRMADRFNKAGESAKKVGLQFAYHNHDFEFVPIAGQVPFDVLLEATDPSLVKIELDLYWITKAGSDWQKYFTRWPGRFPMVHVKDSAGPPQHEMRDVGAGSIPFATIFAQRQKAGIEHFFVEHDEPRDPLTSVRASYDHLRRLTF
jgi:sugar phosphate isomerase/epimerase